MPIDSVNDMDDNEICVRLFAATICSFVQAGLLVLFKIHMSERTSGEKPGIKMNRFLKLRKIQIINGGKCFGIFVSA